MYEGYTDMGTKLFTIPMEEETRIDVLNIDRHTKDDIRNKHRLYINSDWECNTIANVTLETVCKTLYSHIVSNGVDILSELGDNQLNFYDLIEVAASNKKNESAEKNGNINIKFFPGIKVESIISDDIPEEQKEIVFVTPEASYSYPDDTARTTAMLKIDKIARKLLAEKYSIILTKDYQALATTCVFLENLYKELIRKSVQTGKPIVNINMNDLIEFHATRKTDSLKITATPGMAAKLIIKSDESADEDDSDDE